MRILIGENIKRMRKSKNITQEQLANIFNVSTVAVCKWESGETYPDITLVPEIAYYFNMTIDELLGYDESKMEEDIIKIINEYDAIPNKDKYNGNCSLINEARLKYPHDYRIAERYIFDKVGGYADNDPKVLVENGSEILKICSDIKNNCKDIKIKLNLLTLEAKVLDALGKREEALEILDDFPSLYHSSNQRKEQFYNKGTKEYYQVLVDNLDEVARLFGDKLAKSVIYNDALSKNEKDEKLQVIKDFLYSVKNNKNLEVFKGIEEQFLGRIKLKKECWIHFL